MTFTANFLVDKYTTLKTNAMKDGYFELDFGATGGKATWEGQYDVFVNDGEVNAVVEMTIVVYPSSAITIAAGGSST